MSEKTEHAADKKGAPPPTPPQGNTPAQPKEVLSEMEEGTLTAKGEHKADAKTERAPRDNRRIVQGVQFPSGAGIKTFVGDSPEDLDALEAAMTPEQCKYLQEKGAIEGDWSPSGKTAPPMVGSRAELATRAVKAGPGPEHTDYHRLQTENQHLKAQLEKHKK